MDFIKKHLEKFLLAGVLLMLIGVAGLLAWKVEKLSEFVKAGLSGPVRKAPLKPTLTDTYSKAIAGFTNPTPWRISLADPFRTAPEIFQQMPEKTSPEKPAPRPAQPFKLSTITRKPFRYVFKSYNKPGENFAIGDSISRRTFFVGKVGDKIWSQSAPVYDTGFVVTKFDKKDVLVENPHTHVTHLQDESELTIQRGTEPPLVLPLNRIIEEREPEAVLTCTTDNQNQPVRKNQSVLCGGRIYNVVDITLKQVIIVDEQTKEKLTISKE